MNAKRRKQIQDVWDKLDDLKSELESIMEEEQEAYDNLPESIQSTERGERMQEAADNLQNAIDAFDDVTSYLESAME